jgi:hypothetical protein
MANIIQSAAERLFWTLVLISMVWTFGMMLLRKADIGDFFAEFTRFIIFTGFYFWLLTNAVSGHNIAGTIISLDAAIRWKRCWFAEWCQSFQYYGYRCFNLESSNK